jgi:5'-3' exoribonuclease 1
MGIPSYFSYIVKNHPAIIKKYVKDVLKVDNLYLDCNSIIYDCYNKMNFEKLTESVAITIIRQVISKVEEYISIVDPQKTVIIAFDGVAPVAKLEQQRQRRYKSWYQNEISKEIYKSKKTGTNANSDAWNTAAITPGTIFMSELNTMVSEHFKKKVEEKTYLLNILVSGSNEAGEGEHKLFDYIRQNPDKHLLETTVIYGLDADLIMLSINHLPICPNIYLFRETPHFIQSIDSSLEPNSNYFLDIPELTDKIIGFLNNEKEQIKKEEKEANVKEKVVKEDNEQIKKDINKNKVYDYIFICFFLGNDFLPHFPALNIRTGGVDKMLNAYRVTVKPNEFLTDGKTINWQNVRKLISYLSSYEHEYVLEEHKTRDYRERNANKIHLNANKTTLQDDEFKTFENCPQVERELEKYIDPFKPNWQRRYYRVLLNIKTDTTGILTKDVAMNYLQGLEWTMKYYTTGCADWRWQYKYSYPPLLQDLIKYVPVFPTEFVSPKPFNPVTEIVQLCYVLPRHSLHLLPKDLGKALITNFSEWYPNNCEFVWAYCRYFWESHAKMNDIDIKVLEHFLSENKHLFV